MRINLISGLKQVKHGQVLVFKRMYSHNNTNASIYDIVERMSISMLHKALNQVHETIKINNVRSGKNMRSSTGWYTGASSQTKAGNYAPMPSKRSTSKHPDRITRCLDSATGKYILVKTYVFKGNRADRIEIEDCKLDFPAEFFYSSDGDIVPDPCYDIKLINYYLEKKNVNEYVLRESIMMYLKRIRKNTDNDLFKSACNVFDKSDKMLSRCDKRKNSNIHESNVSYEFLIKNYKKIMTIVEDKKKIRVEDMLTPSKDVYIQDEYTKLMEHMLKKMGVAASHIMPGHAMKIKSF